MTQTMMRLCFLLAVLCGLVSSTLFGQNLFRARVADSTSGEPISNVNVQVIGTTLGGVTDEKGRIEIGPVPKGLQTFIFSCVGYKTVRLPVEFPMSEANEPVNVTLVQTNVEMKEVTVTTTRTSYHLDNVPVRIEVKGEEDIGETMIDHPSSISELFLESTGMQVLQTSAVSNYVSIKLQGLDGSYTQILKDGFPLYGGLSSGLSVTQIPPLDLSRVEIVKGPSSSLYGGGAITGIINLISKKPEKRGRMTILLNGASSRGIDAGAFYSKQHDNVGFTLLVNGSSNSAYDGDHTGFSDIPKEQLLSVNPRIFWDLSGQTNLTFGISTTSNNTSGGDMTALANGSSSLHPYLERTNSNRTYTQFQLNSSGTQASMMLKNSIGYFSLSSSLGPDRFGGTQWMSYTEATVQLKTGDHILTGGLNVMTDRFAEDPSLSGLDRSYGQVTTGLFAQDDWNIITPFTLETGIRFDITPHVGTQFLPRLAGIYKVTDELGFRASVGSGYKIPTIFAEQSTPDLLYKLGPMSGDLVVEKSIGGEFDVSYNAVLFDELTVILDQALFYTRVNNPLVVAPVISSTEGMLALANGDGYLDSRGAETDVKITYGDLEAFIGYTFTDARKNFVNSHGDLYLTPSNRFVTDVVADAEDFGTFGAELRYTDRQLLHDGSRSPAFWVVDLLFQKKFSSSSVFVGIENLFNYQEQTYTPVFTGNSVNPQFNDVWAPLEGRIVNIGLKLSL